jgi:integrative and conjugative element protein (TIGR02256 family)
VIAYSIGVSSQMLLFYPEVIARFERHQQLRWWQCEAGGQLFARFRGDAIHVVEATGPRRSDRRSRYKYEPDRRAEQREIEERFPLGVHFIGDWHTHPEDDPRPSAVDLRTTADGVRTSRHGLHAFVMVIAGRAQFPAGLYVALHDGNAHHVLEPVLRGGQKIGP